MEKEILTSADVRNIIEDVGYECKNFDGLKNSLNFIVSNSSYWKTPKTPKSISLKDIENSINSFSGFKEDAENSCLLVKILLEKHSAKLFRKYNFLKEDDINKAIIMVLEVLAIENEINSNALKEADLIKASVEARSSKHPTSSLVGHLIPRIYEEHFGRNWGVSRPYNGGDLYGPAIRFTQSILKIMDIDKNPEAIYKTYKRAQNELVDK